MESSNAGGEPGAGNPEAFERLQAARVGGRGSKEKLLERQVRESDRDNTVGANRKNNDLLVEQLLERVCS